MKKYILLTSLFMSLSSYASNSNELNLKLSSALQNNTFNQENTTMIIYGGQDFSHSQIATAHQNIWGHEKPFMG